MQIKVFKAGTMKEAMAAMKAELGDDAVILHSKKYKEGGLLGIGSKEVVEITAAVEESALPSKEVTPRTPPRPTLFSNAANKYKTSGTAEGLAQAYEDAEKVSSPAERLRNVSARPTLVNEENAQRVTQSDALAEKVAAQNQKPSLVKETPAPETEIETAPEVETEPESESVSEFEKVLQDNLDVEQPAEVESQSDAEILGSAEEVEEEISETVSEDEVLAEAEEELADAEEFFEKDDAEKISEVAEDKNLPAEKVSEVEEKISVAEEKVSEVEEEKISADNEVEEVAEKSFDKAEIIAKAKKFLTEVFAEMKVEAEISVEETGTTVVLDLSGKNLGILIGKHGQTLDALQYLTNLAANRNDSENKVHFILDIENYRERREETLQKLAKSVADRAFRMRQDVRLEPMNRHERRIIHTALQNNDKIETRSVGEEPYRYIIVSPKRRIR